MRVLVVDDDDRFRKFTTIALEEAGIEYEAAEDGEGGISLLRESPPGHFDLVLLDVQMPKASGWDLLLDIRKEGDETPVIFVTARDTAEERVKGLRMGADDYVVKPVEYDELIARLEAVVRRRNSLPTLDYGDVRMDLARRRVTRAGKTVEFTPREYDILLALVRAEGEVLSRATLLREVWDIDFDTGTNVVDVNVARVRRKLMKLGPNVIETVWKEGYRALRKPSPES